MDTNKDFELIDKFLNNELNENEFAEFERQMQENEAFAAEFEKRELAHKLLDFAIVKNLKEQLNELEEQSKVVSLSSRRKRRMYILSIAASVLVLIGVFTIFMPGGGASGSELAALNYNSPDFIGQRDGGLQDTGKQLMDQAASALKEGNYEAAIPLLNQIPDSSAFYLQAAYYLAHTDYLAERYAAAEQAFQEVANSQDIRLIEEAQWYALLACLAQDNDCSSHLDEIRNNSVHAFQAEAESIYQKLN